MRSLRLFMLIAALILAFTSHAAARLVRLWPYQELLDKSDLVIIATPSATNDTPEHIDLPGFTGQPVIGIETKFTVAAVLKGDKALKDFVLHHYRNAHGGPMANIANGPTFIAFEPSDSPTSMRHTYILFLHREADGRYASMVGQADPGGAIREIT